MVAIKLPILVLSVGLMAAANLCQAQPTVAAILDAGGKQLGKAELASLLKDATARNRDDQNARQTITFKADGTMTGRGISSTFHEYTYHGEWKATDTDQICFDTLTYFGRSSYCEAMYRVGEKYFYASDPAGKISRDHKVFERNISKP